ncbi:MAG: flavodoxin [Bacteroidales bacterium]|nr:flavodoxin [Bacteroidales bacterium]
MSKVALLYAPKGGSVEVAAKRVEKLYDGAQLDVIEISNFDVQNLMAYDHFILGCSTVGAESWEDADSDNEWDRFFHDIEERNISLKGKKVAIFGLGNQILYPEHFVDAMQILKKESEKAGAKVIGYWPTEGYDFTDSEAVVDDKFVGLALDEDNEDELSDQRISEWLKIVKPELE